MGTTKNHTTRVVHRSSVDGEFVKQSYAKAHPSTTERQHVRVPSSPAPSKKSR